MTPPLKMKVKESDQEDDGKLKDGEVVVISATLGGPSRDSCSIVAKFGYLRPS
jgi:hypothetical protein